MADCGAPGLAVIRTRDLRCVFCDQSPEQVPWCEFSSQDPHKPMSHLCYQCGDTCMQRWPLLSRSDAEARAQDPIFRGQVLHLTKVKLGEAAKLFLPQAVAQEETIGIRIEEELVPLSEKSFKSTMNTQFGPERYPELKAHPFKGADGSVQQFYLHRNPAAVPKITLWREHKLATSELQLSHKDCLDGRHGTEFFDMLTPTFMNSRLPLAIPTLDETKQLVQQRGIATPVSTATFRGLPALCDAGALPGGADGSKPANHAIPALGLGGSSALVAMQVAAGACLTQGTAAPGKRGAKHNNGGGNSEAKRRKKQDVTVTGSRALDVAIPDVLACIRGESGVQGKSVLQVLHSWKTQIDAKFQRRELQQGDHIRAIKEHRLRLHAFGLSAASSGQASMSELKQCLRECLTWDGDLPHGVFVSVFTKSIGDVWKQPTSVEQRIAQVAAIASPQPPERRDGDIHALMDIPVAKLRQEDRWRVAHDLWLEGIVPKLMSCKSLDSLSLQAALASVLSLAGSGDAPELPADSYRKALAETCGILSGPSQNTPMHADQVRGLRSLFSPEGAANHIQVLSQLIDSDWRAALKSTMGFSIHEAQSASDIAELCEGLQGRGAGVAWETLLKRWPNWRETLRPRPLQRIAEQARANIENRLKELQSGGVEPFAAAGEGLDLIHLCTEFAQMVQQPSKEEWVKLGVAAKEAHRSCTAEHRWRNFLDSCQKVHDQQEEVSDLVWAELVAEMRSNCDHCNGMSSREEDHATIIAAIQRSFKAKACSEASLSLASRLTLFLPEAVEPELRKMAAASLTASRLVVLGGVPGPAAPGGVPGPAAASTKLEEQPIANIKKALEEFDSVVKACPRSSDIAAWPAVEAIVKSLADECSSRAASEAEAAKAAWEQALINLADNVTRCDWKERLPPTSECVWSHIVREMEYKFWKSDESPLPQMEAAYGKVEGAKALYDDICKTYGIAKDGDADKKHKEKMQAAQITNTEEYLARHLQEGSTASQAKIGKRIDQTLNLFPYDSLCPVIRKAVHDVTGL